jgi:uncharacterized protein (DUF362 family)
VKRISRREFIRTTGALGLGLCALGGLSSCLGGKKKTTASGGPKPRTAHGNSLQDKVVVVRGTDLRAMVNKAVGALGGMKAVVKQGDVVVVKPNIGWISRPELGGCTHPDIVAALVALAFDAGARQVKVFDRPCHDPRRTYPDSGIQKAAEDAGATVSFMAESDYVEIEIPGAKSLTSWPVYRDVVEADVIINVPVAKVHGTTGVTLGIKNLMGVAGGNRGRWHSGIHQKLADWLSALPCDLTVIDATRPMMRNGPDGGSPNDVERADTIVAARDIVAADAWCTREIFSMDFGRARLIALADEMGLGSSDYASRVETLAV